MTSGSLKHILDSKLMPGQLLSSKHLAVSPKVDHWVEQQLATASSHTESGFFVPFASICRLLVFVLVLLFVLLLVLVLLLGRTWFGGGETIWSVWEAVATVREGGTLISKGAFAACCIPSLIILPPRLLFLLPGLSALRQPFLPFLPTILLHFKLFLWLRPLLLKFFCFPLFALHLLGFFQFPLNFLQLFQWLLRALLCPFLLFRSCLKDCCCFCMVLLFLKCQWFVLPTNLFVAQ